MSIPYRYYLRIIISRNFDLRILYICGYLSPYSYMFRNYAIELEKQCQEPLKPLKRYTNHSACYVWFCSSTA